MDLNTIYLVYNKNIETPESLSKFVSILQKSSFDPQDILPYPQEDFELLLEKEIPKFAICLNQTFKDVNITYSDKLGVPIFEFFSKEFVDLDKGIVLSGILLNIESVFEPAYKRYTWDIIQKFHANYLKCLDVKPEVLKEEIILDTVPEVIRDSEKIPDCPYLDDEYTPPQKVEKIDKPVVIQEKVLPKEPIVPEPTFVEPELKPVVPEKSCVDFESFYLNVQQLISQFNIVQEQLKMIEKNR